MVLRASAEIAKNEVDLHLVTGEVSDNGGIDHGKSLVNFVEAFVSRDEAVLETARSTLHREIGPEAMVDAAAVAGNFQRMARIADATGIPLDAPMRVMAKDIQDELEVTILLIEHDMNMVMDISDRILVINFGSSITEGTPEDVQKHPEVLKAYLGSDEDLEHVA